MTSSRLFHNFSKLFGFLFVVFGITWFFGYIYGIVNLYSFCALLAFLANIYYFRMIWSEGIRATFCNQIIIFLFLVTPLWGNLSYQLFILLYGKYLGTHLDFSWALYLWYLSVLVYSIGVCLGLKIPHSRLSYCIIIEKVRLQHIVTLLFLLVVFSALVIFVKLGYIPLLKGDIDSERFGYSAQVGRIWFKIFKISIVVSLCAIYLYLSGYCKKINIFIVLTLTMLSISFGQRQFFIIQFAGVIFMLIKYDFSINIRKTIFIIPLFLTVMSAVLLLRAGGNLAVIELGPLRYTLFQFFGEWRDFTFVVSNYLKDGEVLGMQIFGGVFASAVPEFVWNLFGVAKNDLLLQIGPEYFKNALGFNSGVRVGPIGELYAAFGFVFTMVSMGVIGFVIALVEKRFFLCDKDNCMLLFHLVFLINVVIFPLLSFFNVVAELSFFLPVLLLTLFFSSGTLAKYE